ncbi:hypothetical protein QBC42DRAFT_271444 [Cladorrhinum samala]|uniref:Uncharacterized protein n=1 Tax=Cladorrhinum samala TaxID=585594 RepID=A0AAV9HLB3_9PEZI|nr:hypothetical protein QBC42DRAFT_271444 [Cladorrhinum samala]
MQSTTGHNLGSFFFITGYPFLPEEGCFSLFFPFFFLFSYCSLPVSSTLDNDPSVVSNLNPPLLIIYVFPLICGLFDRK